MKLPSVHGYLACLLGLAFVGTTPLPAQSSSASPKPGHQKDAPVLPGTLALSENLPPNGTLVLSLNVGDLQIAPSPDGNRLHLEIHAGEHPSMKNIHGSRSSK
jgi:hypothetical protein